MDLYRHLSPLLVLVLCFAAREGGAQSSLRTRVQARPGGPVEDIQMSVHRVPVEPPSVPAQKARLEDGELVLGLVLEGRPMAYPIRYLSMVEVLNDRIGDTPIAPTW